MEQMNISNKNSRDEAKKEIGPWMLKGPSELALAAVEFLKKHRYADEGLTILDVACGNGRDSFYLIDNLNCNVLGADISEEAIELARNAVQERHKGYVKFDCIDFKDIKAGTYDIIFIANIYYNFRKKDREQLWDLIKRTLKPNGILFLTALSVNDKEYYGKGEPVLGEYNSFMYSDPNYGSIYIHFHTREELEEEFGFLAIKELYEYEPYDPDVKGPVNYLPWILIGEYAGTSDNTV
jgi:2-polyprenyl-3-methyl-5-hydroxy-6-metoxy-1,4-benzoquinol methylase